MYKLVLIYLLTVILVIGKPVDELKSTNAELSASETVEDSSKRRFASFVSDSHSDDFAKSNKLEKESVIFTGSKEESDDGSQILKHSNDVSVREQKEKEVRSAAVKNITDENIKSPEQHHKNNGVILASTQTSQSIATNDVDASENLSRRNYEQDYLENLYESVSPFENTDDNPNISGSSRRKEVKPSTVDEVNSKNHEESFEGEIDSRIERNFSGPLLLTVNNDEVTVAIEVLPNVRIEKEYDSKIHTIEPRRHNEPIKTTNKVNIIPGHVDSNEKPSLSRDANIDLKPKEQIRIESFDKREENDENLTGRDPEDVSFGKDDTLVKDILTDREHLVQKVPALLPDNEKPSSDIRASDGNEDEEVERGTKDLTELIIPGTFKYLPIIVTKVPEHEILPPKSNHSDFVRLIRPDISLTPDRTSLRAAEQDDLKIIDHVNHIEDYDFSDRNAYPFSLNTPSNRRVLFDRHQVGQHNLYPSLELEPQRKPESRLNPVDLHLNKPYTFRKMPLPELHQYNPVLFKAFQFNQTLTVPHLNHESNQFSHPYVPMRNAQLQSNLYSDVPPLQYKQTLKSPIYVSKFRFETPFHDLEDDYLEDTPNLFNQQHAAPLANPFHLSSAQNQYKPLPPSPNPHFLNANSPFQPNEPIKLNSGITNSLSPNLRSEPIHLVSDLSRNNHSFNSVLLSPTTLHSFKFAQPSRSFLPSSPNFVPNQFPNYLFKSLPVLTQRPVLSWPQTNRFAPLFPQTSFSRSGFFTNRLFY